MKLKTMALTGLLMIGLMAAMPTASAALPAKASAADCDPNEPALDWASCVINEAVSVPPWVGQIISDALQTVRNAESKACAEYERATGESCPL